MEGIFHVKIFLFEEYLGLNTTLLKYSLILKILKYFAKQYLFNCGILYNKRLDTDHFLEIKGGSIVGEERLHKLFIRDFFLLFAIFLIFQDFLNFDFVVFLIFQDFLNFDFGVFLIFRDF